MERMFASVDVEAIKNLSVLSEFSEKDTMKPENRGYYFFVGRQNLFTIFDLLNVRMGFLAVPPKLVTLLDFGCGCGRVTRWMRAGFPEATIHVTDIDMDGPLWCAEKLDAVAVHGPVPELYDLIWLGSRFTHLRKDQARPLMTKLLGALRPGGVLAITALGRAPRAVMLGYDWVTDKVPGRHFHLDKDRFDELMKGFEETGYGYVSYASRNDYGMCVAKTSWYSDLALTNNNAFTQIALIERADGSQDLSAFMRNNLDSYGRGALW